MPGRIEKTAFISYRRTNIPWALLIYQDLTHHGYDVFFDYKNIKSGDFEQVIIENIQGRAHFVVILTPSALERCNQPGDWLRREIELAIDEKRNIIPLMLEGFNFSSPSISKYLTGKLAALKKYNGLNVPADYFEAAMVKLRNDFLTIPLNAVLHPISDSVQDVVKSNQTAADSARQVESRELREQLSFERGRPLLEENESILYEGIASHGTGVKKVGGHLFLTNQRLIFKSHILNIKASEWHVFLQDVLDVTPSLALGFVPNEISVKTKSGLEKFIVFERNTWLKLIQDART
ncbi:MAG TPA: TIR domain-containing protein [Anaerolineales bacterium]